VYTSMHDNSHPLILLFSPREQIRSILTAGLIHANYRIQEASTAYVAGVKANQYTPDLIIIDISNENIRDFLFLTRLERSIRTQNIPVLLSITSQVKSALNTIREEAGPPPGSGEKERFTTIEYPFKFPELVHNIKQILSDTPLPHNHSASEQPQQNEIIENRLFDPLVDKATKLNEINHILQKKWAFPFTVVRAIDIIETESSCCAHLGHCIKADPAATSAIMSIANRVRYAKSSGRIASIEEAIIRIGFRETKNILASLTLIDIASQVNQKYGFSRSEFWIHSLSTAIIAEQLCKKSGLDRPELSFIAGLLHDIGKIPLDNNFTKVFPRLLEETTNRIASFHDVELVTMGFSHADLGSFLAKKWAFNETIINAIKNHHDPQTIVNQNVKRDRIICSAVFTANILAKAANMGHSCDEVLEEIPQPVLKELQLTEGPGDDFFEMVQKQLNLYFEDLDLKKHGVVLNQHLAFEKDFDIRFVTGSHTEYYPLISALQTNGYTVLKSKEFSVEDNQRVKAVIFLPDHEMPLDITLGSDEETGSNPEPYLKIFLLEGLDSFDYKKEFDQSNTILLDRRRLDLRLVLHVIEDYYLNQMMASD